MTLYAADVMDLAKPVGKKSKKKEELPTPPTSEPEVKEKPKRVLTDAQKAALKAGQEKRKQKKLEEQAALEARQKQAEENEKAMIAKLEEKKAKRREAAAKRKAEKLKAASEVSQELDKAVEEVMEPKPKKQRKKKEPADPNVPPAWFEKYIEGVKREQAEVSEVKKPKKEIQAEASQMAQEKWQDGMVRDRLRNELDGHANRMYSMIFGRR